MASSILLVVLLVLVSLSLTCGYSPPTRDALFKQDDESYFVATSDQGSSMIDVEDLAKAPSLRALVAGSKVVVNKASKSSSTKSTKGSKKKKHKSKKVGSLDVAALVGIIIAAIVVTIVIICVICYFISVYKTKKALSTGQEKINGSSETQTSKSEDRV